MTGAVRYDILTSLSKKMFPPFWKTPMRSLLAIAAALVLTPASVLAQAQPAAVPAVEKDDPNKPVCHTMDITGSRLGKRRECRTPAEWAAISAASRQDVERQQTNRGGSGQ